MLEKLRTAVKYLLDPPWEIDGPENLTLAIPDAQSTFKQGAVGWAHRPPARLRCPSCGSVFAHLFGSDVIRCSTCRFERPPERFDEVELIDLSCPDCGSVLTHGIRHPNVFEVPEWAACPNCQYHWEFQHF